MTMHIRTVWHPRLEKRTYREHRDIIALKDKVYWCAIHGADYPNAYKFLLDEHMIAINKQIANETKTYLFIETRDPYEHYFWGKIAEPIIKGNELQDWESSDLVPSYYKSLRRLKAGLSMSYWFLLSDLREISHNLFMKAQPVESGESVNFVYEKYLRPYPTICDFEYEGELRIYLKSLPKDVPEKEDEDFIHSDDYRSIKWRGEDYTLTDRQAQTIEILHENYERGTPDISQAYILVKLDSNSKRLGYFFKKSPLWGTLIIRSKQKGTYRINLK
jgi:hypothetical protein